jgi:intracellular sulfur oxidation DsrE/DsrF family protein
MKIIPLFYVLLSMFQTMVGQENTVPPHLIGKISYPVINTHPYMGVIATDSTSLGYDQNLEYKIVIDVYEKATDSTQMNNAIREVARTYNLNVANGVPEDRLHMIAVVHGWAVDAILSDSVYMEKFGRRNPNTRTIKALNDLGVTFYVCGQNLGMFNIPKENLLPEIEVALSAKTAFITLDQMGFTYLNVNSSE